MDYGQPPGKEARLVGYSLNRHQYANDPRGLTFVKQNGEHGLTSPQIVYLNGRRFMFVGGMFASNFINIFLLPLRRRNGHSVRPDSAMGQRSLSHGAEMAPEQAKSASIWRDLNGDGDYQG